jgi:hypothetical protein
MHTVTQSELRCQTSSAKTNLSTKKTDQFRSAELPKAAYENPAELVFPSNDKAVLFRASLLLFLRRLDHHIPIYYEDLIRLGTLLDRRPAVGDRT